MEEPKAASDAAAIDVVVSESDKPVAGGHGVVMPLFSLVFGQIINGLNSASLSTVVASLCLELMGIAIAAGVAAYFQFALANVAAVRQTRALRLAYVAALLRQDVAWHDAHPPGETAAWLVEDTVTVEDGLGAKLTLAVQGGTTFIAGFVLAFTLSWKMSLVLLGFLPLLGGVMAVVTTKLMGADKKGADAYADAGDVASEALTNVRTVAAFGGEADAAARYEKALTTAEREGVRKATLTGVIMGTMLATLFLVYGCSLLWGAKLVIWSREENPACIFDPTASGCFTGGTVMQVLFALIMGAGALGQMAPSVTAMTAARAAGGRIFAVLDRVPPIDSSPKTRAAPPATVPEGAPRGRIEFRDVTFAYPSRPTVPVLLHFSLTIEAGERLALVGPSGGGKSTLVALAQRWYDVSEGAVLVDGVDVREWDVQALRSLQALVSQESLLLAGTVAHNIALGTSGLASSPSDSDDDGSADAALTLDMTSIQTAAAGANASGFIDALPGGINAQLTNSSLSGGQRQRLCIARALLRVNAPILLLDEATSALDTASEQLVQSALDSLTAGARRTTLTIAHRLSTIEKADRVVVLSGGAIVESGPPHELIALKGGIFKAMREAQALGHSAATVPDAPAAAPAVAAAAATPSPTAATTAAPSSGPAKDKKEEDAAALKALVDTDGGAPPRVSWLRIAGYNAPETLAAVIGLLACCVTGGTMPAFAYILSNFIAIYYNPNPSQLWTDAIFYMGMFFLIGGLNFFAAIIQQYCFGLLGERLVRRVRAAAFGSLLRFEISWHDKHPAGSVTAALGSDAYLLKGATGTVLALNMQNLVGLCAGLGVAFAASWRITLVVLGLAPLIAIGGALQIRYITSSTEATKEAFAESGAVASESLGAPRTLAAYALQRSARAAFARALAKPTAANARGAWASGIGMSLMATFMIGTYAVIFGVGSIFIKQGVLDFQSLLQSLFGVMFAAMGMGQGQGMAADGAKATLAANALFALIDRVPRMPSKERARDAPAPPPRASGALSFRGVSLEYPGREGTALALDDVTLDIAPGSLVALVGASGSGKTSLLSLLERFYEPSAGAVLLDGVDIRELPPAYVRSQIALVMQEPSLFSECVGFNVGFPLIDSTTVKAAAPSPALEAATRAAGAHDFVAALPEGYATRCGTRGSQLSGGQKQRICIARALLRDAPIMLLDEATSALDTESEKLVQASIDALIADKAKQRTVLVIAHRLSTVRNADVVVVLDRGKVKEVGSWEALSSKAGGAFAAMLALQGLK